MVQNTKRKGLQYSDSHKTHQGKLDGYKVGKCSIYVRSGSYQLRYSVNNKSQAITIGSVCEVTFKLAVKRALEITEDISNGEYDFTREKYQPKNDEPIPIEKPKNLREIWEDYKKRMVNVISKTTQKREWVQVDRLLSKLSESELLLENLDNLGDYCLKHYAIGGLVNRFKMLNPAINLYFGTQKIDYINKQLPKQQKKKVEWFTPTEVITILEAFKSDTYNSKYSKYKHSFYYGYIAFCALTGCRPEETRALTWDDIKWSNNDKTCQIIINKAYTEGILQNHTKTHKIRVIPCSDQLKELIKSLPKTHELIVFPSIKGDYIDGHNFSNRIWNKVLDGLVKDKLIRKRLRPYCLRHSFATNMLREGVDIATVAGLLGDSVQTVINHYIGSNFENANIPNIYDNETLT